MRFFLRKSLHLVLVAFAVTAITFVLLDHMPVSAEHEIVGRVGTLADARAVREQLGLDAPLPVRYGRWLSGALRGELGASLSSGEPVVQALGASLPVTVELMILAQILELALAVPVAIAAAWRPGSWWDRLSGTIGFGLGSLAPFALALVLMFIFSLRLKWFPATGFTPLSAGWLENLRGLLLPALSLALVEWVILMQVLRSDLIATLQQDFILLARAKGLPQWRIMFRHALRPSCFSLVTLVGLHGGNLLGGAVVIENVFALPGIGRLLLTGLFSQDYPLVAGCILVVALGYLLVTFLVDLCYGVLDPRVRREGLDG